MLHRPPCKQSIGFGFGAAQCVSRRRVEPCNVERSLAAPAIAIACLNATHRMPGRMVPPAGIAETRLCFRRAGFRGRASRVTGTVRHSSALQRVARVAPARAKQGKNLDDSPDQGVRKDIGGVACDKAIHGDSSGVTRRRGGCGDLQVVERPDHRPFVIEEVVDDAKNVIEHGLHMTCSPNCRWRYGHDKGQVLQRVFMSVTVRVFAAIDFSFRAGHALSCAAPGCGGRE